MSSVAQPKLMSHTLSEGAPESVGIATDRLERIDKVVKEYVDKKWIAGAVGFIARHGKIVYYKAHGYDDIDTQKLMQKEEICRIASQTKAITSVAAMILFEEGKFLLDDPISKYIPEFANPKVIDQFNEKDSTYTVVKAKREPTIRDLFTHTSGIGYGFIHPYAKIIYTKAGVPDLYAPGAVLADKMKILAGLPLMNQPGEKFTYGLSVDMLGYLVELWSGEPLDVYFSKHIFQPLGMKDTYFYLPKEKQGRLAAVYNETKEGKIEKIAEGAGLNPNYPNDPKGSYFSGGGGLSSTVYDYAVFLQTMLNGGEYNGKRILTRKSVEMMTMNQIGDLNMGINKFGLGFEVTTDRETARLGVSAGAFRWGGVFATNYWADPKEGIIGLFYMQVYPTTHGDVIDKFKVLTYQAITE